ncbi:MAG: hypothetical protein CVT49_01060 [candidate division Zixibacteria bacterium HGW-Zixibacteria-1]|nr:MAG: hypothetical protein CVT49_01060 [candidate division Zixibacteria bacterium HGW-Zixibacteria-1]
MALSKALLEIIVCPKCKGELEYRSNENKLNCNSCRLSFRVEDEIPVLLIDEAEGY